MRILQSLLDRLPGVYDDLELALVPATRHPLAGTTDGEGSSGTRVEAPAPAELDVIDHRHKLVRGLRWWVDAVRESGEHTQVGHDVGLMARWLADHLDVMADEDAAELHANLNTWYCRAAGMLGALEGESTPVNLPPGAGEQVVRVADAARLLGCTVRTVQRRVPAEHRPDGRMELWRALPDCPRCDLKVGAGCACRRVTLPVA